MEEGVLIKIGADIKEYLSGLSEVSKETETMGDKLKGIGQASAVAFAGFAASITAAVYAYHEQEMVGIQINNILKSTGSIAGVTKEEIEHLAKSLSEMSTFDDDAVLAGEKVLLQYTRIGQETFPEATKAAVDLAASMGTSVANAAEIVGRALEAPDKASRALRQAYIILSDSEQAQIKHMIEHGNRAGAQALILDLVKSKTEGMAAAMAQGTGVFAQLGHVTEDLYKAMGKELAPAIESVIVQMRDLVRWAKDNEALVKFIAWGTAALAAVTGLIAGIYALTVAWGVMAGAVTTVLGILPALQAGLFATVQELGLMEAASIALGISVKTLVGATGIGLLVIALVELAAHWDTVIPALERTFTAFAHNIGSLAQGLGKILVGAFMPGQQSLALIKEGGAQMAEAFKNGWKESQGEQFGPPLPTEADKQKLEGAVRGLAAAAATATAEGLRAQHAEEDRQASLRGKAEDAHLKSRILALQGHSQEVVALQKLQGDLLEAEAKSQDGKEQAALQKKLKETQALQKGAEADEVTRTKQFHTLMDKEDDKYQKLSSNEKKKFQAQQKQLFIDGIKTQEQAQAEFFQRSLERHRDANNQFLADQIEFGTAYAAVNQVLRDEDFKRADNSFAELAQLTKASGNTLKAIGQVAASEQVAIKTIQSAMDIFAGWAQIPFIGYALGIAGAAAAIAYGVEQEHNIWAAAEGGVMMGGIPGRDSIPTLTMPGELISPTANFEEVVGSVAATRAAKEMGLSVGSPSGNAAPQRFEFIVMYKGDASKFLTVQINKDKALGRYRGAA